MNPHRSFPLALALLSATAGCFRRNGTGATADAAPAPAVAVAIPAAAPTALPKDDLDQLRGGWRIELLVWDGVRDASAGDGVAYSFEGDKFIMIDDRGNRQVETIKLMPGQTPKAIDCWGEGGRPVPGIYSLEGDKLTWCAAGGAGNSRPTAFSSEPGSRRSLMVFRREEP
jgi:uncharacterized protein (TIGR03067 family)